MRQRRRAERGHFSAPKDRVQGGLTRRDRENRLSRLLLIGLGLVVILVVGLLGFAWFSSSYQPPRKLVAEIGGEEVKLRDVIPYTLLNGTISGFLRPEEALNSIRRDLMLEQRSGSLGVALAEADIERAFASQFEPLNDGSETPDRLSDIGQANLDGFLDALDVDDEDYRDWVSGNLLVAAIQNHFVSIQPEADEQVFIEWFVTVSSVEALAAMDRIEAGETFAEVAQDVTIETSSSDENGVVGWVPRGAFSEIDFVIYDEETPLNVPIGPLVTSFGSMVLRVTDGPSEQPVNPILAVRVAGTNFQDWVNDQTVEMEDAGLLRAIGLDPEDIAWVLDQLV